MAKIIKFFDKLEDRTREHLSRVPIIYAVIGGIAIVLFWRGIWDLADVLAGLGGLWAFVFHPFVSLFLSAIVLLVGGLFVSFFIGDRIIMSGLKHEKKVEEKTEAEVREEEAMLAALHVKLDHLTQEVEALKSLLKK
ncbi:MAG: hypothetical protein HYV67_03350 [Candidatus Taylorbacteria bacterium]|nr:hypothetical protein [Candidatus Taylorbacteria bacterium]